MKKTILTILAVSALTSCYEDKGNYDYSFDSLNKIDIENVTYTPEAYEGENGKTIEIQTPLYEDLTQRITVNLNQTLSNSYDNLEFNWIRTTTKGDDKDAQAVKDTIHSKGYIDLDFPVNTNMKYSLFLEIIDPTTSLGYYTKLTVKTRPLFQNSLFVLHGTSGNAKLGNIEVIGNSVQTRTDAYATAYRDATDNPFQNTIGLGFSAYSYLVRGNTGSWQSGVNEELYVFNSDGTGKAYQPFKTLAAYNAADYVLPHSTTGQPFVFSSLIDLGSYSTLNDFKCVIAQDGRFYTAGNIPCFHVPNEQVYDNPSNLTDYAVRAATMTSNHFLLWDAKNNRFMYQLKGSSNNEFGEYSLYPRYTAYMYNPILDAAVDFSSLGTLTPVGKTAVYAFIQSHKDLYEDANARFLFKDASGKYYLYELTSLNSGKKSRGGDNDAAYSITGKELPNFNPSNDKTILFNLWFDNYLFYANGSDIYRYNLENGDATLLYTVPGNGEVSIMKFRTTASDSYNASSAKFGDLGLYLSVGLNQSNGTGAITEIKLNTAGDYEEQVFYRDSDDNGNTFGPIMDLQFAHLYNYNVSD